MSTTPFAANRDKILFILGVSCSLITSANLNHQSFLKAPVLPEHHWGLELGFSLAHHPTALIATVAHGLSTFFHLGRPKCFLFLCATVSTTLFAPYIELMVDWISDALIARMHIALAAKEEWLDEDTTQLARLWEERVGFAALFPLAGAIFAWATFWVAEEY